MLENNLTFARSPLRRSLLRQGGAEGSGSNVGSPSIRRIACREIRVCDLDATADLLTRGFRDRDRRFWVRALHRLTEHPTPRGFAKYGYLLEQRGVPKGVLLLIFSSIAAEAEQGIRGCTSSWYIEPDYRAYASLLAAYALRHRSVTYVNITPDPRTWPILQAQGWQRYCEGRFISAPALFGNERGAELIPITPETNRTDLLPTFEMDLLRRHAGYGCISLVCRSGGEAVPFVFLPYHEFGTLPAAHLAYCRRPDDFVRFSGALARYLTRRGMLALVTDASCPVKGLVGCYLRAPKYFKGPLRPAHGDMAYSERVVFGF